MAQTDMLTSLPLAVWLPTGVQLPAGDGAEVEEKGMTLFTGQKQQINMARAVYVNKDVYLLEDLLSALDAEVIGCRIRCRGEWKGVSLWNLAYLKTRADVNTMLYNRQRDSQATSIERNVWSFSPSSFSPLLNKMITSYQDFLRSLTSNLGNPPIQTNISWHISNFLFALEFKKMRKR